MFYSRFLLVVLFPIICHGQVLEIDKQTKTPLEKISEFDQTEMQINYNDQYYVPTPLLASAKTSEDSTALAGQVELVTSNYVRMDPAKIEILFPEAVSVDEEKNISIDYLSFIPILLEAINEQQKLIAELQEKIQILENKIGN